MTIPYTENTPWADGATAITAAKLNNLEQGVSDAQQQPAVRVFHNANQSLTTSVSTVLAFNSERFDTAGGAASTQHDTVTNNSRLTCLYAGKYEISASISFDANATGVRQVLFKLNATTTIAQILVPSAGATFVTSLSLNTLYDLAVNDYVETFAFQSSGGALNVGTFANHSPEFMMCRIA